MNIDAFIAKDPSHTEFTTYRLVEQDILVSVVLKNFNPPAYQLDFFIQSALDAMGTEHYYEVIDLSKVLWIGPDVQHWIQSEFASRVIKGYAVIAESPASEKLLEAWMSIKGLRYPVKRVKNYLEGLEWIRQLKGDVKATTPSDVSD